MPQAPQLAHSQKVWDLNSGCLIAKLSVDCTYPEEVSNELLVFCGNYYSDVYLLYDPFV